MKKLALALFIVFTIFSANVFAGPTPEEDVSKARLVLGTDRWVQLHYFLQTGISTANTWDATNNETSKDAYWSKDFYINRSRIILNGQVSKTVHFFFQSDDLNAGQSYYNDDKEDDNRFERNSMYTKDAYIAFKPTEAFQVYAGLMALPYSRQNLQSAATTLGTDLHQDALPLKNYSDEGRDTGLMFRGFITKFFEYRLGVYRGLDRQVDSATGSVRNEDDMPRLTGRFQLHLLDAEKGFFYSGNYMGRKSIFSIGGAIDYQKDVFKSGGSYEDYLAWTLDINLDQPIGGGSSASAQAGFFKGTNNPVEGIVYDNAGNGTLSYGKYFGYYVEAGVLIMEKFQPFAKYSYRRNKNVNRQGNQTFRTAGMGLNYYINGHHANIKLEGQYPISSSEDYPDEKAVKLQFQVYL